MRPILSHHPFSWTGAQAHARQAPYHHAPAGAQEFVSSGLNRLREGSGSKQFMSPFTCVYVHILCMCVGGQKAASHAAPQELPTLFSEAGCLTGTWAHRLESEDIPSLPALGL